MLGILALVSLVIAVAAWTQQAPMAAIVALLAGAAVLVLLNPVLWAALLRARERDAVDPPAPARPGDDTRA